MVGTRIAALLPCHPEKSVSFLKDLIECAVKILGSSDLAFKEILRCAQNDRRYFNH